MAALALGVAGGLAFGPIGFLVGSMVGNLLFPTKQEGPRLSDLRLTGSSYGQMIPIIYGVVRPPGNAAPQVVWQTDLKEHKHSSGGKGGPEVTTYTYSASFAVKCCKGPIGGFLKIWANSTLVYDVTEDSTTDNTQVPVTFYLGVESANPDPTMEGVLGVGNVPAFRDDAAAVFTDWDLSPYGNTIPQLSFLMFSAGGTIPWRVSTFDATVTDPGTNRISAEYDNETGIITVGKYHGSPVFYAEEQFLIDGTVVTPMTDTELETLPPGLPGINLNQTVLNLNVAYGLHGSSNSAWYRGASILTTVNQNPIAAPGSGIDLCAINACYQDDNIYGIGSDNTGSVGTNCFLTRWPAPAGVPGTTIDATYHFGSNTITNLSCHTSDDTTVWVRDSGASGTDLALWQFDKDLALIHAWQFTDLPSGVQTIWGGVYGITFYHSMLAFSTGHAGGAMSVWLVDQSVFTMSFVGQIPMDASQSITLKHGLILGDDGVISLDPPAEPVTLESVLDDISNRCGLDGSQQDFSAQTQLVDGFVIDSQSDGKTIIGPLQRTYHVDFTERAGVITGVNRGGAAALSIPDSDLAAQVIGSTPPPLATIKRTQEVDLPATVNVNYMNEDAAYQKGSQQATRQVTMSQAVATIDLAVAMVDQRAKNVANILLFEAWQERMSVIVLCSRKYNYLEPTDVISAHGFTLRIMRKSDVASGIIQLECVETLPSIYTAALSGNPGSGYSPSTPVISQPTTLILLDVALLNDGDDQTSLYGAVCGAVDDTWRGTTIFKSSDLGTTYNDVASASSASVIAAASSVLGDFFGGNNFDESNSVTVVVGVGGGELSGATQLAVLNGANEAILGQEIIQYKNADLIAPSTYLLSGFLRGRRGTEQFTGTHIGGEIFCGAPLVLLPSPSADLYQPRKWKPVTFGQSIASTVAQDFTDIGNSLKPYSPAQVGGGADASGNVTMNWFRRTRIGGTWLDYVDVPLSEATEGYVVQIWDSSYTICARIIMVTTQTATYSAANQVTDFGAVQETVFFTVGQLGSFTLGAQTQGQVAAGGGSNDIPLAPIHPYVFPPVNPPPGPSAPVDGTLSWPTDGIQPLAMTIGQRKVYKFTTGTVGPGTAGFISVAEFGSPTTGRHCFIATDTGGVNIVARSVSYGTTATSFIGSSTGGAILASSTVYYYIFDFVQPDGSLSGPPGANAQTVLNMQVTP